MTRRHSPLFLLVCAAFAGCGNRSAQAPNPTVYHWPDAFAYRLDYVTEAQRDRQPVLRYAESKTLHLVLRDRQYLAAHDSVLKTSQRPGEPVMLVPYVPEDTLAFNLKLGTHGEITDVILGCDPSVPECAEALPSSVELEIRRIIPRLPIWEAPSGSGWADTLRFDDAARPRGTRGTMITQYTGRRDTIIVGEAYWVIGWRSERVAFERGAGAALRPQTPVHEEGVTLVNKRLQIPTFATWAGAVAAPPELQAMGATASGFRGRAYLAGSVFDSSLARTGRP